MGPDLSPWAKKNYVLEIDQGERKNHLKAKTSLIQINSLLSYTTSMSSCVTYILANGGKVTVKVDGKRENSRGNGLEVPGLFTVKGPYHSTEKGHSLIKDYCRQKPCIFE